MAKIIYLDHHSTTPLEPRALRAMMPSLTKEYGNPSNSQNPLGKKAFQTVQKARAQVSRLLHLDPSEIVFTGSATESNNLAIKGLASAYAFKGNHIISTQIEHKSVLDPLKRLETQGFRVTYLEVDREGRVDPSELKKAITSKTIFVSVIFAHNEIGVIQPMREIGQITRAKNILFHSDAAQAAGKIPVDPHRLGIDLLSLSSHKLYGPKGVGALFICKKGKTLNLIPQIEGGAQESGMRSGTLNVAGIAGFGKAAEISQKNMEKEGARSKSLRDFLAKRLLSGIPGARINGSQKHRLPHNLHMTFPGVSAKDLMAKMPHIILSSGSACLSTSPEPSYTLKAMGLGEKDRHCSIRVGLGRSNTQEDVRLAARKIIKACQYLAGGRDGDF